MNKRNLAVLLSAVSAKISDVYEYKIKLPKHRVLFRPGQPICLAGFDPARNDSIDDLVQYCNGHTIDEDKLADILGRRPAAKRK